MSDSSTPFARRKRPLVINAEMPDAKRMGLRMAARDIHGNITSGTINGGLYRGKTTEMAPSGRNNLKVKPSALFNYSKPRIPTQPTVAQRGPDAAIPTQPTVAQRGPDAAPRPGALVVPEAGGKQIAVRAPAPQGGGLMRAGARLGAAAAQTLGRALPAGGRLAAGAASVGNLLASYGNSDDKQPSAPSQSAAAPASAPDDTAARQRVLNRDFSGPKPDGRPDVVYGWAGYGGAGRQLVSVPRGEHNGQAYSDARREFYRKHEQDRADAYAGTMQREQRPSVEGLRAWNKANPFNYDMYERDARAYADAAVAPRPVAFNAPPTALNRAQATAAGAPSDAYNAQRFPDGSLGYARPGGSPTLTTGPSASVTMPNGKVESTPRQSLTPRSDSVRGSSVAADMVLPGAGPMMIGAAMAAGAGHDATRLAATQKASDGKPAAAPAIPMGTLTAQNFHDAAIDAGSASYITGSAARKYAAAPGTGGQIASAVLSGLSNATYDAKRALGDESIRRSPDGAIFRNAAARAISGAYHAEKASGNFAKKPGGGIPSMTFSAADNVLMGAESALDDEAKRRRRLVNPSQLTASTAGR